MSIVFDADIISTFAKIGKLDLLKRIFKEELLFPDAVHDDLIRARDAGYDYVTPALQFFKLVSLNAQEAGFVQSHSGKTLGLGELECIAICKYRKYQLSTNDAGAKAEAKRNGVKVVDLSVILWKIKENTTLRELQQIIQDIEQKDRTKITGKEQLLTK